MPVLSESVAFDPEDPNQALRQVPSRRAVFALYGPAGEDGTEAEPYIGATPDLRRRLERLLRPASGQTRRLQLVSRIRRIAWATSGSEFEALLTQFAVLEEVYGARALERMKLRAPAFVRFHGGNPYPRLTITNRTNWRETRWAFGPFPSRAAAERYAEELLKLFLLRRCEENLEPNPAHPGCVYSEMKMCLAPCYQGCTDERYAEEAEAVRGFLATRGGSRLVQIQKQRDRASEELEFEAAARLHTQLEKVESVRALAPELVHSLSELRVCVLQAGGSADEVRVFLYQDGELRGPAGFSTLGMRIQNEQSGSSSLFAQPMAMEPVALEMPLGAAAVGEPAARASRDVLEARMEAVLEQLSESRPVPSGVVRQGHLALLTRWYYRPQTKRVGEICFPNEEDSRRWPIRSMLRSVGRVVASTLR